MRKCRIGTAKFFTLLLLLYRTSVNAAGLDAYPSAGKKQGPVRCCLARVGVRRHGQLERQPAVSGA
ncbi:hypothetical protein NQ528_14710 [Anaerotruncus colihominis]|nr:hypothetical protein [Anaerotruncus colihominis]UWN74431.1 hypothetical protein NQ528_14710 [Anaerotruncus colihominis]